MDFRDRMSAGMMASCALDRAGPFAKGGDAGLP